MLKSPVMDDTGQQTSGMDSEDCLHHNQPQTLTTTRHRRITLGIHPTANPHYHTNTMTALSIPCDSRTATKHKQASQHSLNIPTLNGVSSRLPVPRRLLRECNTLLQCCHNAVRRLRGSQTFAGVRRTYGAFKVSALAGLMAHTRRALRHPAETPQANAYNPAGLQRLMKVTFGAGEGATINTCRGNFPYRNLGLHNIGGHNV